MPQTEEELRALAGTIVGGALYEISDNQKILGMLLVELILEVRGVTEQLLQSEAFRLHSGM